MRSGFLLFILLFLLLPVSSAGAPEKKGTPVPAQSGATVLIYHRVGEDKYPTTNIGVERFREQLEYLKSNDYTVISLEKLLGSLAKDEPLPPRSVILTMDDGYRSVYEKAWPLLREYGYPFTVFLYVQATEKRHWDYMTWEQVREMQAAGVDFQNHGFSHDHMAFIPAGMEDREYRAWIRADLGVSTRILSEELQVRPRFYAVPYGEYNEALLDEVRAFGYEGIFLQDPGSVSSDTDPFAIPREPILGKDWSTMEHFQAVLERVDLPLGARIPRAGRLADTTPEKFEAKLLYPERYVPGTVGIYVSELGWQQAEVSGDGIAVVANSTSLSRRINRVAVSGREKESGRTAIRFWMIIGE